MALARLKVLVVLLVMLVGPAGEPLAQGAAQSTAAGPAPAAAADTSFCGAAAARAADTPELDVRGLRAVYCSSSSVLTGGLDAAHWSARPVFYGAAPAMWGGALIVRGTDGDFTDAYRFSLTQVVTYGLTAGLKRLVGRPRPYVRQPLRSRSSHYASPEGADAFHSFPSGHASLSAGMATSLSLSHPRWYVIGPSLVWASAVALSRLHLGVHYPSDVLAGAVLGAAVATAIHLLRRPLTPRRLEAGAVEGPSVSIRVPL